MLLVRLQRTRDWCEPGRSQKQKILPECELKSNLLSKGTGLISVIHDTVYSKTVNWFETSATQALRQGRGMRVVPRRSDF
jgi:hypothetical protein